MSETLHDDHDAAAEDAAGRRGNLWGGVAVLVVGMFVLPIVGLLLYGVFLPDEYEVSVSGTVDIPREVLWETLTDPDRQGDWRPGVTRSERGEDLDGQPVVVLYTGETKLTVQRTLMAPPGEVAWTIVPSKKHVFQGGWLFTLSPSGSGTHVVVTERGMMKSAFARAVTHAFFGVDRYANASIHAMGRYHEVDVTIDGDAPGGEIGTSTP